MKFFKLICKHAYPGFSRERIYKSEDKVSSSGNTIASLVNSFPKDWEEVTESGEGLPITGNKVFPLKTTLEKRIEELEEIVKILKKEVLFLKQKINSY